MAHRWRSGRRRRRLGEPRPPLEVAAYRIATEALTNVVRHSSATRADVRIGREPDELPVEVVDDGSLTGVGWRASGLPACGSAPRSSVASACSGRASPAVAVRARLPLELP